MVPGISGIANSPNNPGDAVPFGVMMAAVAAYQGDDILCYPELDHRRLARAIKAALDAKEASFRAMLTRGVAGDFEREG